MNDPNRLSTLAFLRQLDDCLHNASNWLGTARASTPPHYSHRVRGKTPLDIVSIRSHLENAWSETYRARELVAEATLAVSPPSVERMNSSAIDQLTRLNDAARSLERNTVQWLCSLAEPAMYRREWIVVPKTVALEITLKLPAQTDRQAETLTFTVRLPGLRFRHSATAVHWHQLEFLPGAETRKRQPLDSALAGGVRLCTTLRTLVEHGSLAPSELLFATEIALEVVDHVKGRIAVSLNHKLTEPGTLGPHKDGFHKEPNNLLRSLQVRRKPMA